MSLIVETLAWIARIRCTRERCRAKKEDALHRQKTRAILRYITEPAIELSDDMTNKEKNRHAASEKSRSAHR